MIRVHEQGSFNVRKIEKLIDKCNYQKAQKLINQNLEANPQSEYAYHLLAKLELSKGNNEKALENAGIAFQLNNKNIAIALVLACALFKTGHKEKSLDLYYQLNNAFPDNADVLRGLEQHFVASEDYLKLFNVYSSLNRVGALTTADIDNLECCVLRLTVTSEDSGFDSNILWLLTDKRIDPYKVHGVACSYFIEKYHLSQEDIQIDLDAAAEDELFKLLLRKMIIRIPVLDSFCTSLRTQILDINKEEGTIPEQYYQLTSALAHNNWHNEYIQSIQSEETQVLARCDKEAVELLDKELTDTNLFDRIMLLSMYQNLWQHPIADYLYHLEETKIPEELHWLNSVIVSLHKEIEVAKTIESLTSIQDEISLKVREMYEENPYPRWVSYRSPNYKNVLDAFKKETSNTNTHFKINLSRPKILIAGCGTGYEMANRSNMLKNAKVTAIDISKRSIAYAKIKAEEINLNNIHFYHADILELDKINESYDVILCSGVLHHLADPMKGWRNLRTLLKDNGLMRIALYSEKARSYVNKVRKYATDNNMTPSLENVRIIRDLVFTGQIDDDDSSRHYILQNGVKYDTYDRSDFCAFSNCRDLIFHVQEKQYTIMELKSCLQELSLKFLGFSMDLTLLNNKEKFFPTENSIFEIDYWDEVEKANPHLFRGMYRFWCQAIK